MKKWVCVSDYSGGDILAKRKRQKKKPLKTRRTTPARKKPGRNDLCPCGSGKKFKRCCIHKKPVDLSSLREAWLAGDLKPTAEVHSNNGSPGSMVFQNATLVDSDGNSFEVFNDDISLEVGGVAGDKGEAWARVAMPNRVGELGEIFIQGNATITNPSSELFIELKNKKMKAKSDGGLFASAKKQMQRDVDIEYLHVYFGEEGREETIGGDGQKDRPHISFHPTGNGKYLRFSNYDCKLISQLRYNPETKMIYPLDIRVEVNDYDEVLVLKFNYVELDRLVILDEIKFVSS